MPSRKEMGEVVGAGYFVFRRGRTSGRIKMSPMPFEHPTKHHAVTEAARLAEANPGQTFEVFERTYSTQKSAPDDQA